VIRENQVRAIAEVQAAGHVDAGFCQGFNFGDQRRGINNHSCGNDRMPLGSQNSAGNQLQHKAVFANDDGVAGVVAAADARNVLKRTGKVVHDLAFAFIAPLRPDDHDRLHFSLFLDHTSTAQPSLHLVYFGSVMKRQVLIVSWPHFQRKLAIIRVACQCPVARLTGTWRMLNRPFGQIATPSHSSTRRIAEHQLIHNQLRTQGTALKYAHPESNLYSLLSVFCGFSPHWHSHLSLVNFRRAEHH
jgi:hypothetical protein